MDQSILSARCIASSLPKSKRVGNEKYIACCPAHDDKNPSLSITEKNHMVLVYCHAGCSQSEVINALKEIGLWHSMSSYTRQNSRKQACKAESKFHQILLANELARAEQGYTHTTDEQNQIEKSVRFLERQRHG